MTLGEGFPEHQRQFYIYDRLVTKVLDLRSDNIARGGSSNFEIFMRSADAICRSEYDAVFTQWTALNRMTLYPGPDSPFTLNDANEDFQYRHVYLDKKQKSVLIDQLRTLNHDYKNMFWLIDYCKILQELAWANHCRCIFINGVVPWTSDLCADPDVNNLSEFFSPYTKDILDFDHRDDTELLTMFQKLQSKFSELDPRNWVNLFDSFQKSLVDLGPEGHHPGIDSHRIMADKVISYLNKTVDLTNKS